MVANSRSPFFPLLPTLYLQYVSFKSVFTRLYQAVMSVVLLFLVGMAPARSSTPSNDHVLDAPKIMLTHADDSFSGTSAHKQDRVPATRTKQASIHEVQSIWLHRRQKQIESGGAIVYVSTCQKFEVIPLPHPSKACMQCASTWSLSTICTTNRMH